MNNNDVLVAVVVACLGCDGARPQDSRVGTALTAAPNIPGFSHTFEHSRFKPGGAPSAISDMGFSKLVGTNGVFSVDEVNGWVLATPNGGAPSTLRPPYPGTAADHDARVLGYFLASGIPKDQIAGIQVHTLMQTSMSLVDNKKAPDTLLGYYSILNRAINGVPVADSTAWARFNADDEVVEESVFWPELPASVLDRVSAVTAAFGDSARLGAIQQKIEAGAKGYGSVPGRIVIHHADSTYRGTPFAVVTYDVFPGHDRLAVGHFDETGQRITLAHETQPAPVALRSHR